jgi:hypothetical protein
VKTRDFTADSEVQALVVAFEQASVPAAEFTHAAHIAVGLAYVAEAPLPLAAERMRTALIHFVATHGASGYHETLTVF